MIRRTQVRSTLYAALLMAASLSSFAATTVERPLIAGQHTKVGTVSVSLNGNNLTATYAVTAPGMVLHVAHLYVATSEPKSAAPGRFPFQKSFSDGVTTYSFVIDVSKKPVSWTRGKPIYIAAHAEVCEVTETPDLATMASTVATAGGSLSVFQDTPQSFVRVETSAFGTVYAWCVQEDAPLYLASYDGKYVLTYNADGTPNTSALDWFGSAAQAMAEGTPINLLNFLINQPYAKECGSGIAFPFGVIAGVDYGDLVITASEIQVAIWAITNGANVAAYADPNNDTGMYADAFHVRAVLAHVVANGASFVPSSGDLIAVLVDPTYTPSPGLLVQNLAFGIVLTGQTQLTACNTAWAQGQMQFRTGWGSYFKLL